MNDPDDRRGALILGPYRLLGVPLILISIGFGAMPLYVPLLSGLPNADLDRMFWPRWIMAGFTGWVGLACFVVALQPATARLVGLVVFGLSLMYLTAEILTLRELVDLLPGRQSQPSLWNSVSFFVLFGLPAGYVLIHGDLPDWTHPPADPDDDFDEEHH